MSFAPNTRRGHSRATRNCAPVRQIQREIRHRAAWTVHHGSIPSTQYVHPRAAYNYALRQRLLPEGSTGRLRPSLSSVVAPAQYSAGAQQPAGVFQAGADCNELDTRLLSRHTGLVGSLPLQYLRSCQSSATTASVPAGHHNKQGQLTHRQQGLDVRHNERLHQTE